MTPTTSEATTTVDERGAGLEEVVRALADGRGRIRVERGGVPVAAVVSADDLERLDAMDQRERRRREVFTGVREAFADVMSDELLQQAVRDVRAVREQMWEERLAHEASARSE